MRNMLPTLTLLFSLPLASALADDAAVWTTSGFEGFSQGTFDSAGSNLYVSKGGRVQMIKVWDVNGDEHVDLYFGQSHDLLEYQPALIYHQRDGRPSAGAGAVTELPSLHSSAQCVTDLNGDGYTDVVMLNRMYVPETAFRSYIYWGGPEGLTPKYRTALPTFTARQAFAADLNGDGLKEVIVLNGARHRFDLKGECISIHWQTQNGLFPPDRRDDIVVPTLGAADVADLNGDGFADLVFHGRAAKDSLTPSAVPVLESIGSDQESDNVFVLEGKDGGFEPMRPLAITGDRAGSPRLLKLKGIHHLAMLSGEALDLYPFSGMEVGAPTRIKLGGVRHVVVADINADGIEDLACLMSDGVKFLWGSDSGHDPEVALRIDIPQAQAIAVGDLSSDGQPDVAVAVHRTGNDYRAESRVYLNTKAGLDVSRFIALETSGAAAVHVSDLDHDGANDVIFACGIAGYSSLDPPARVYLGSADGTYEFDRRFDMPAVSAGGGFMADFNDDGFTDMLVANQFEGMTRARHFSPIYLGGPDGLSADRRWEIPTKHANIPTAADVNRDGYLDAVLTGVGAGATTTFWGGPEGYSAQRRQEVDVGNVDGILLADVDKDGWLDLVCAAYQRNETYVLLGDHNGFEADRRISLPMPLGGAGLDVADLDNNGWLDVVLTGWSEPRKGFAASRVPSYIWWGSSEGFRPARRTEFATLIGVAHEVSIADLNQDGHLDIVCSNYARGESRIVDSYIFWGDSRHAYSIHNMQQLRQASALGIQVADLNHDGWLDIAFSNHSTGGDHRTMSRIHWNRKGRFSDDDVSLLPTRGPHTSIAPDLGNDYTRELAESYVSKAFARPQQRRFRTLSWQARTRPGCSIVFQVRTAGTEDALKAAPWAGPEGPGSHFTRSGQRLGMLPAEHPWIQYRAILRTQTGAATPILTRVEVAY